MGRNVSVLVSMNVEIVVLNCHNGLKSLGLLIVIVIVILGHPYIGPQVHLGPIKIKAYLLLSKSTFESIIVPCMGVRVGGGI